MPSLNLPGFSFSLREGYLVSVPRFTETDSVVVIGCALDGPEGIPVTINSPTEAYRVFGPVVYKDEYVPPSTAYASGDFSGNTLVRDIEALFRAGCTRVIGVRVGGVTATGAVPATGGPATSAPGVILISGLFNGSHYNGTVANGNVNGVGMRFVTSNTNVVVTLHQPAQRGGNLTYTLPGTTTVASLIDTVNNDPRNQTVTLAPHPGANRNDALNTTLAQIATAAGVAVALSGGAYGTKNDQYRTDLPALYTRLTDSTTGVLNRISDLQADIYVMSALYADDKVSASSNEASIMVDFAKFLHKQYESYPCHGVIGCRPISASGPNDIRTFVNNNYLTATPGAVGTDQIKIGPLMANHPSMVGGSGDSKIEYGRYISVVAGIPAVIKNDQMDRYVDTPYAPFAGMLSTLGLAEISAFKSCQGILDVAGPNPPSDAALALINGVVDATGKYGGAYIVLRRNPMFNNQVVVVNDVTAASRDSMFAMQSNARIANKVLTLLRNALSSFLGKPNTADVQAAMATTIRSAMETFVEANALLGGEGLGYRFTINPRTQGLQMTEIEVLLDIVPAAFIRQITLRLTVRP
jgi:hypothetical protein